MDRPLKERLTGASILVLIAVLFIPELLSGPAKRAPAHPAAPLLDVPTNAAATVRTYTVDLNHPATEASAVATPAEEPASLAVHDQPAASSVQVAVPAASSVEAATVAASVAGAASAALETPAMHPHIPEATEAKQPPVVKPPPVAKQSPVVKPPPVAKQPQVVKQAPVANKAPPHAPAPATFAPISAKGGWSIQLGSFGNRANAEKLVKNLRSKGIRVYVSSQGGKHRVRAGPFPDRTTAERVGARLKSQGQPYTVIGP